jgi:hypothetical protein
MPMKIKYTLFRRGGIYYSQDSATGQQKSLRTRDKAEALQLINARDAANFTRRTLTGRLGRFPTNEKAHGGNRRLDL